MGISVLEIPKHIRLADTSYNRMGKIDLLLGAGIFFKLLCADLVHLGEQGSQAMQKTILAWAISGPIPQTVLNIFCKGTICNLLNFLNYRQKVFE